MDILVIQILNALLYASVLFLITSGLSLIYGVMGIVNVAHGSLYALGAYVTAWVVVQFVGVWPPWALLILLPSGAIAVALVGMALEPTLLRPFYKRPEEYQLLLTFGLLLVLEDVIRFIFGAHPLAADTPMNAFGTLTVLGLYYPGYNFFVIVVGILSAIGLWAFVYRTRFGVMLRATSQNMKMASALGLNVGRVYVFAFGIGCFLAGLGGAIVVPTQSAVLGMGLDALIIAFVVVVVGGIGSLQGALIGSLIVSFVRTAGVQFFPEIELAVLYLIAAIVLIVKPTGLFGKA